MRDCVLLGQRSMHTNLPSDRSVATWESDAGQAWRCADQGRAVRWCEGGGPWSGWFNSPGQSLVSCSWLPQRDFLHLETRLLCFVVGRSRRHDANLEKVLSSLSCSAALIAESSQ